MKPQALEVYDNLVLYAEGYPEVKDPKYEQGRGRLVFRWNGKFMQWDLDNKEKAMREVNQFREIVHAASGSWPPILPAEL